MSVQYNPFDSVTTAFSMPIMNVPGKNITSLLVDYPPGEKAPAHRHGSAFVICYVLSGDKILFYYIVKSKNSENVFLISSMFA